MRGAEPDHRPHRLDIERVAPGDGERMVERGGDVAHAVDERAVEVEADDGEGKLVHRGRHAAMLRSEEHTSELKSLMRISYAVFCLKKKQRAMYLITSVASYTNSVDQNTD